MSNSGKPAKSVMLMLLNLSVWIYRQPWLKEIYRHFPQTLRNDTSEVPASRTSTYIKFQRTPNWEHRVQPPASPTGKAIRRGKFGAVAGVNVFVYTRGQSGLGESPRLHMRALLAESYPVAVHNIDIGISHGMADTSLKERIGTDTPYAVNLVFVNPFYLDNAIANIGYDPLANRYTMACWFWNLEKFPEEWLPTLQVVNEIMVSSSFIRGAIRLVTDKPISHMLLSVDEVDDSGLTRADSGLMGKLVIVTAWSDNMKSMMPVNSCLADYQLIPMGEEDYFCPVGHRWALTMLQVTCAG